MSALLLQDLAQHLRQLPEQLLGNLWQQEREEVAVPDAVRGLLDKPKKLALVCMQVIESGAWG